MEKFNQRQQLVGWPNSPKILRVNFPRFLVCNTGPMHPISFGHASKYQSRYKHVYLRWISTGSLSVLQTPFTWAAARSVIRPLTPPPVNPRRTIVNALALDTPLFKKSQRKILVAKWFEWDLHRYSTWRFTVMRKGNQSGCDVPNLKNWTTFDELTNAKKKTIYHFYDAQFEKERKKKNVSTKIEPGSPDWCDITNLSKMLIF